MQKFRNVFFVLWAAAFALGLPYFLDIVEWLGYRIPQTDRSSDFLKGVAVASGLWLLLFLFPARPADKRNLLLLWAVKATMTLSLMLLYEWNYGLDAYWYFQRSQTSFANFQLGWGNGTENLVGALWWLEHEIFRTASYHALKVLSSFLGLMGVYLFYRGLANYSQEVKPSLLLYIGLFPSVLFWSSILGKDPVNLLGICIAFYGVLGYLKEKRLAYLVILALGLLFLSFLRLWMVPLFLLPFAMVAVLRVRHLLLRLFLIGILGIVCLYSLRYFGKSLAIENAEALTDQMNRVSRSWQKGGSAGSVPELTSLSSVLLFLPYGMFTALFRPLPWDVLSPFGLLAGLENLFLLYLLWQSLRYKNRPYWNHPVVLWFGCYVILWAALYAFISPQNLGSSVRFKLQVLPALLMLLTYTSGIFKQRGADFENSTDSTKEDSLPHAY